MNTETLITWSLLVAILVIVGYQAAQRPRMTIKSKQRSTLIDTSVLIDGRIVSIAKSGFIGDTLVVPRSVVGELQFLADNGDADKRARARMGLDVISELQSLPEVTVELLQDGSRANEGVDERLLTLAKANSASICTIDYNLNKVAVVEGIRVLNINELAQGLRLAHLPGEKIQVDLVQKGQDSHQGVGYLSDGTMVVVEHASSHIGSTVETEVIRSLQTAAGKMMFAKLVKSQTSPQSPKKKERTAPQKSRTLAAVEASRPKIDTRKPKPKGRSQKQREAAFIDLIEGQAE
jgi:uncharacterized protein YacL